MNSVEGGAKKKKISARPGEGYSRLGDYKRGYGEQMAWLQGSGAVARLGLQRRVAASCPRARLCQLSSGTR